MDHKFPNTLAWNDSRSSRVSFQHKCTNGLQIKHCVEAFLIYVSQFGVNYLITRLTSLLIALNELAVRPTIYLDFWASNAWPGIKFVGTFFEEYCFQKHVYNNPNNSQPIT